MATQLRNNAVDAFGLWGRIVNDNKRDKRAQATQLLGMHSDAQRDAAKYSAAGQPEAAAASMNLANSLLNPAWMNVSDTGQRFVGNTAGGNYMSRLYSADRSAESALDNFMVKQQRYGPYYLPMNEAEVAMNRYTFQPKPANMDTILQIARQQPQQMRQSNPTFTLFGTGR